MNITIGILWGFKQFMIAIAAWILHLYTTDPTVDFWYSLQQNSPCFLGWQFFELYTCGWDCNLNQKVDTFPQED